jgi:hypothetical protein
MLSSEKALQRFLFIEEEFEGGSRTRISSTTYLIMDVPYGVWFFI